MLSLIVAHDENRVIGINGDLPWRLSSDLRRFKRLTMGHAILMGRKTYDSIGRPLPGRKTIVITRDEKWRAEGCHAVHGLDEALAVCADDSEPFIVGGAEIYRLALPRAARIYRTRVHTAVEDGDAFFPPLDAKQWRSIEQTDVPADDRNDFASTFEVLERVKEL